MVDLSEHLHPSRVGDLKGRTKDDVLAEMVALVRSSDSVEDPASLLAAVRERERVLSTGIGLGIAIPHAKIPGVSRFVVAVGRHAKGIDFDAIDGRPVHLVVLIAGPQDAQDRYLRLLARLSQRLKQEEVRKKILAAGGPEEIVRLLEGGA
jgi:mannitol/fructose-specific phosphotransferase system IIA component (Ntr-type)